MREKPPRALGTFMTADEVAEYCDVSRALVFQWRHRGRLSALRIGRAILFAKPEVKKFRRELRRAAKHRAMKLAAPQATARSSKVPSAPRRKK